MQGNNRLRSECLSLQVAAAPVAVPFPQARKKTPHCVPRHVLAAKAEGQREPKGDGGADNQEERIDYGEVDPQLTYGNSDHEDDADYFHEAGDEVGVRHRGGLR